MLAVNDQAEDNFVHLEGFFWGGGSLICLGPITNMFFLLFFLSKIHDQ